MGTNLPQIHHLSLPKKQFVTYALYALIPLALLHYLPLNPLASPNSPPDELAREAAAAPVVPFQHGHAPVNAREEPPPPPADQGAGTFGDSQDMDNVESTGASGSNTVFPTGSKTKSVVHWTTSMSTMMLGFLADIVASGKRTSSGFKVCHHNQCVQVLNEHFKLSLTHEQCSNHLKKWRKIWDRLIQLKNLSGALWDEDTCTISLSDEHYAAHCNNNKPDIPLLNTPIEHYRAMETIFGTSTATGKYAKSGNDPLSIDVEEEGPESEVNASPNVGESAEKAPAKKKAKLVHIEDDALVTTLKDGFKMMAESLVKSGGDDDAIPDGLFDALKVLNGFDDEHITHYYAHLVENPKIAKAFMTLSKDNKLIWVGRYVLKTFGVRWNLN